MDAMDACYADQLETLAATIRNRDAEIARLERQKGDLLDIIEWCIRRLNPEYRPYANRMVIAVEEGHGRQ